MSKTLLETIVATLLSAAAASTLASTPQQPPLPVGDVLVKNLNEGKPFPDEGDSVLGDHLKLRNHVVGFYLPWDQKKTLYCAAKDSWFQVDKQGRMKFFSVPLVFSDEAKKTLLKDANGEPVKYVPDVCKGLPMVSVDVKYVADEEVVELIDYKRTGAAFGTLVVPFKFRLGKDKKLVSSSTIAPYIGFRHTYLQGVGLSLMPVIAGGLAIVPVKDEVTNDTNTKAGVSLAGGVTLTSAKNKNFSAGVLFGWDYLSKNDRKGDPTTNKPWISFWLGINN